MASITGMSSPVQSLAAMPDDGEYPCMLPEDSSCTFGQALRKISFRLKMPKTRMEDVCGLMYSDLTDVSAPVLFLFSGRAGRCVSHVELSWPHHHCKTCLVV